MSADGAQTQAWYREAWPWILMAGPATAVVAGLITAWLALRGEDGLVADDYYRQGLAINRVLGRSDAAERYGVRAELYFADGRVRVTLGNAVVRGTLILRLAHPTRAGLDQSLNLTAVQRGVYEGQPRTLRPGRWHIVLEDRDWRLTGDWILPAAGVLSLGSRSPTLGGAHRSTEDKQ